MNSQRQRNVVPRRQPAIIGLMIGLGLTITIALISYFWPQSDSVKIALLVSLVGISVSVSLNGRLKLGEIEQGIGSLSRDSQSFVQIQQWAKRDSFIEAYSRTLS
jgi:hypothetical protein